MSSGRSKGRVNPPPNHGAAGNLLITDAEVSPQDRHRRKIGYGILMFLRTFADFPLAIFV